MSSKVYYTCDVSGYYVVYLLQFVVFNTSDLIVKNRIKNIFQKINNILIKIVRTYEKQNEFKR